MYQKLNKAWRIIGTGICFSFFGLGGLILALVVFPVVNIVVKNQARRQEISRGIVKRSFAFFVKMMDVVGVVVVDVKCLDYLKSLKGQLILANHPSLIDVVVLISIVPNVDCVVKSRLFRNPFMAGVLKGTGYISNEDPEKLIVSCKSSLANGSNIIIFPEGTRTTPGESLSFQRGAANIAIRCNAEIACLSIDVSPTALTKQDKWYQVPESKINVVINQLYDAPKMNELSDDSLSKNARLYTRQLEQYFTEELYNND